MRALIAGMAMTIALTISAAASAGPVVINPPDVGPVVLPPPITLPAQLPPPEQPRNLQSAPPPQFFMARGIEGVYAYLRSMESSPTKAQRLRVYEPYGNPATPADASKFNLRQIVVKFVEGSAVRLRDGALAASTEPAAIESSARLARIGLEPVAVQADLASFNERVKEFGGFVGRGAPAIDELDLLRLRQAAERNTGFEQPDANLFYFVHLPEMKPQQAQGALDVLLKHRIVEVAYFEPIPFNAVDKPPTTTINVTGSQGYFALAPQGIDVNFARKFAGGRGEGVRIADIEAGWDTSHEDLPPMGFGFGVNWGSDHGTAVLGEIAALENGFGGTGVVPNALIGWSSVTNLDPFQPIYFYSVADALLMTGNALRPGDIALIEQHFPNPFAGPCPSTCPTGCSEFGYVAVETLPFEHTAISLVTGAGVVVVEAAGNGTTLVSPASSRDSGAIVVGASKTNLVPECWSNFGPRVNVHAWGQDIGSLGYGGDGVTPNPALRANLGDADQWYTLSFSGTSGASPIVVGAAALIQSTRMAVGLAPLDPVAMRTLLVTTGTPQLPGSTPNIGPLPNLRAAIATYRPDAARFVSQTAAPPGAIGPGVSFNITENFLNSGGQPWVGGHTLAIVPSQGALSVFGVQGFSLGAAYTPVDPGQSVAPTFTLQAPAQAGTYDIVFSVRNPLGQILAISPTQQIIVAGNTPYDAVSLKLVNAPGSMKVGLPGIVIVTASNTGTTTWTPQTYALRITGSRIVTVAQAFAPITTAIAPGQSQTFTALVTCQTSGFGSFSVQMKASGPIGSPVGQTVNCQP